LNERAREQISALLREMPEGRIIPDEELEQLGAFFPDRRFGELIFLVHEGVLIVPSHMGERPITAMHGYHPSEPQSFAAIFSNRPIPAETTAIPHIYELMRSHAEGAHAQNQPKPLLEHSAK
jgi:hypothetical protein